MKEERTPRKFPSHLFRNIDELVESESFKEQELIDSYAAQAEMMTAIREIYNMRGEDSFIAVTCNKIIEKYGSHL
jgi:hypothetical protein